MNFFERHPWVALALCLLAYAIVSTMDYEDARAQECAQHDKLYDKEQDKCR